MVKQGKCVDYEREGGRRSMLEILEGVGLTMREAGSWVDELLRIDVIWRASDLNDGLQYLALMKDDNRVQCLKELGMSPTAEAMYDTAYRRDWFDPAMLLSLGFMIERVPRGAGRVFEEFLVLTGGGYQRSIPVDNHRAVKSLGLRLGPVSVSRVHEAFHDRVIANADQSTIDDDSAVVVSVADSDEEKFVVVSTSDLVDGDNSVDVIVSDEVKADLPCGLSDTIQGEVSLGEKPGYCYQVAMTEKQDLGPCPSAEVVLDTGKCDVAEVKYVPIGPGIYHCQRGTEGLSLEELPRTALIGANDVHLDKTLQLAVLAAAELRVEEAKFVVQQEVSEGDLVDWFAYRWVVAGWYVNVGSVQVHTDGIARMRFRGGIDPTVFWFEEESKGLVTVSTTLKSPYLAIPGRKSGWHCVFAFSRIPLAGAVNFPVNLVGSYSPTMVTVTRPGVFGYTYLAPVLRLSREDKLEIDKEMCIVVRVVTPHDGMDGRVLRKPGKYKVVCGEGLDGCHISEMELEFRREANYEILSKGGSIQVSWDAFVRRVNQASGVLEGVRLYVRDGVVLYARCTNGFN